MADNRRYRLWNGCEWAFEKIIENLTGLVKHILLTITPDEQIQDARQEVWLKLFERLQRNPDLLNNTPGLDNPRYNDKQKRSFLAQRRATMALRRPLSPRQHGSISASN